MKRKKNFYLNKPESSNNNNFANILFVLVVDVVDIVVDVVFLSIGQV